MPLVYPMGQVKQEATVRNCGQGRRSCTRLTGTYEAARCTSSLHTGARMQAHRTQQRSAGREILARACKAYRHCRGMLVPYCRGPNEWGERIHKWAGC